jgi:nicotinamide riboside kinase
MEKTTCPMISIAVTGPESTGKSRISQELAGHYSTIYLPEFAREYLMINGPEYTYETVVYIAEKQLLRQKNMLNKRISPCFFDTDLLVCRIWLEFVFGKCPQHIVLESLKPVFSHTLLMNIDLPWQADPLREHPTQRKELFNLYYQLLDQSERSFTVISGEGAERLDNAVLVVDEILQGSK